MKLPKLPFETPRIVPVGLWAELERFAARRQGKGTGNFSWAAEVRQCAKLLGRPPAVVLDVGANLGDYTGSVLGRFPNATVHAFEPANAAREALVSRFGSGGQVSIHATALSDADGEATLWSDRAGSGLSSLSKRRLGHFGIRFENRQQVRTERLDGVLGRLGIGHVDWIKLDVEGHELAVLRGLGARIADVGLVQFEFGGCNIDSRTYLQDFWYFFAEHGFRLYRLTGCGPLPLRKYRESYESFCTTNYAAVRG